MLAALTHPMVLAAVGIDIVGILALGLLIYGVVSLFKGAIALGVICIVLALIIGPGVFVVGH